MLLLKKIRSLLLVLLTATVCIASIYLNAPKPEQNKMLVTPPKIPYSSVGVTDLAIPIFSRGKVSASEVREVTNEVPGLVQYVSPDLHTGSNVKKNDILIQLDEQAFVLDMAQKQAELDLAKLELMKVEAKAVVAQKGLNKNASEYGRHIPQVRYATSQVFAAETALAYAKNRLNKTIVRAPINGKVIKLNVTEGEFINATSSIATIYGTQKLEVRLPLNDQQLEILGLDHVPESHTNSDVVQPKVTLTSYQDKRYKWYGHVVRTEGERDANQLLYVIAQVANNSDSNPGRKPLLPGSFVEAIITGKTIKDVRVIPRNAEQANQKVWVIGAKNRLKSNAIKVIYRGKKNIYVSEGINENDRIATGEFHNMAEGLMVETYEERPKNSPVDNSVSVTR